MVGLSGADCRLDVVVHTEEVRRIEFVFQSNEAIIVAAVGFASDCVPLVRHVVAVSPSDKKGLQGFPALEQAFGNHEPCMVSLQVDAIFDSLREEERYKVLVRGVGLQP
jgi:hypothetical protein